jgi:hypothetical protein
MAWVVSEYARRPFTTVHPTLEPPMIVFVQFQCHTTAPRPQADGQDHDRQFHRIRHTAVLRPYPNRRINPGIPTSLQYCIFVLETTGRPPQGGGVQEFPFLASTAAELSLPEAQCGRFEPWVALGSIEEDLVRRCGVGPMEHEHDGRWR